MIPLLSKAQRQQPVSIWVVQQCTEEQTDVHLLHGPVGFVPLASLASSIATKTSADGASAVSFVAVAARNDVMWTNNHIEPEKEKCFGTE